MGPEELDGYPWPAIEPISRTWEDSVATGEIWTEWFLSTDVVELEDG
jgi:hypothetical protein